MFAYRIAENYKFDDAESIKSLLDRLTEPILFQLFQKVARTEDFQADLASFVAYKKFSFDVEIDNKVVNDIEVASKFKAD